MPAEIVYIVGYQTLRTGQYYLPKRLSDQYFLSCNAMLLRYGRAKSVELRHLRYFQAVASEGGFGRAALALRVAQPALSRQIRALEHELDTALLIRSPKGVS
jgi:hypothetical protein